MQSVHFAEDNFPTATYHEDGTLARAGVGIVFAKYAIGPAHFAVRPEIAAEREVERPYLAIPFRGVHDGVDADAHHLGICATKFLCSAWYSTTCRALTASQFSG